ncbi:MAG: hypothetical protein D6729_15260, partial [Deltaproteobacteria bacterium]
MSTRRLYDVIVVGGHVGALAAACLLERRGLKVLHVEHDGLQAGYEDGGYDLPTGPEFLPGPKASPLIAGLLEELALTADAARHFEPIGPGLQLLGPGYRLDVDLGDLQALRAEVARALGKEALGWVDYIEALRAADAALDPLLARRPPLPPDGLLQARALRRALAECGAARAPTPPPEGGPLRLFIRVLARLSTYLAAEHPSPLHAIRARARLLHGFYRPTPRNAGLGYGRLLRDRLASLGGESAGGGGAVAETLTLRRGVVEGVEVIGDRNEYRCRFLVSGTEVGALGRLLPLKGRKKRFDSTLESVRHRELLFSTNLVLRREGLPEPLGDTAVWIGDPEAPPSEENVLLLQRFPALRSGGEEDRRHAVLQASAFFPASRRELGPEWLEGLQGRILRALESDL